MILNSNTSDSNARFVSVVGQPQDAGFKLTRAWPWIQSHGGADTSTASNDTCLQDLIVALRSTTTVTTPKANGDTYGGTFVVSSISAKDDNVDGDGPRHSSIVQVLTKVKTVTDVTSLGTPDKGADKKTLNYLGFREGTQEHVYHIYRNLNPANRETTMGLSPTETGYTIVERKFDVEDDKTGTFYVVFEKDTWPTSGTTTWAADRKLVEMTNYDATKNTGAANTGGAGRTEERQLTGISQANYPTVFTAAKSGDTSRVATRVTLVERPNGEYAVSQQQKPIYDGTDATDVHIEMLQSNFGGTRNKSLRRIWQRRTSTAKTTLIGTSGRAVSDTKYNGDTYKHDQVTIRDNKDGSYDVIQDLAVADSETTAGVYTSMYFNESWIEWKRYTRSKDEKIKKIKYVHKVRSVSSERAAWNYVKSLDQAATYDIVQGSTRVVRKGTYFYVADVLLTKLNDTKYNTAWADIPEEEK